MSEGATIGEAARQSGVKIPTIRYYEQIGLLAAPGRTQSRRRIYEKADLRRLAFIRHSRELGFEVDAIRTLLSLQDNPDQSCVTADETARARLAEVEQRIAGLQALRTELQRMIDGCAKGQVCNCRVIETLADRSHTHGRLA
ncbi:MAG: MerR family transcriptional regulator [Rhizobiales bacterium 65-79]|nr:helix-turn-helix domain-containing protein [Hyphomicrobiales bacterium]OJU04840.1 MAG: MerR family transcriptional regulator [Rhizobiales bacterium 65-79]